MPTSQVMRNLQVVLAQLYPDKTSAVRVAQDAGIPIALVTLNDRAIDNWHAILQEAEKQDRLALLLAVVNEEYGANPRLRAVMLQLQGWPALFATLAVMGQQQLTPHRVWLGATLVVVLVIIGAWGNSWLQSQPHQPPPLPTATATVAPPTPTPHPTPASFTYFVTVLDADGQPVAHAQVMLEIEDKASLEDETDSLGSARIQVPASYLERAGRLRVYADGFTTYDQNIDIYRDRLPNTVRLPRP